MPPRPFPFPFRVGTDICSVARVRALITKHNKEYPLHPLIQFLKRTLTDPERLHFWDRFTKKIPREEILSQANAVSVFLAGRFAAKEACRKACDHLDPNSRGFQSIMILPVTSPAQGGHLSSRPQGLILDGSYKIPVSSARDDSIDMGIVKKVFTYVDVNQLDGQLCELSISHDGNYATAVAIVPFPVAAAEKTREISQRFDSASQKLTGEEESF